MPLTTGVTGHVDPLWEAIDTTHTGCELFHLLLILVCGLIYEKNINLSTLEAFSILGIITIPKQNSAAVWEVDILLAIVVRCDSLRSIRVIALEHLAHRVDMILCKFRVCLTDDHALNARIL